MALRAEFTLAEVTDLS